MAVGGQVGLLDRARTPGPAQRGQIAPDDLQDPMAGAQELAQREASLEGTVSAVCWSGRPAFRARCATSRRKAPAGAALASASAGLPPAARRRQRPPAGTRRSSRASRAGPRSRPAAKASATGTRALPSWRARRAIASMPRADGVAGACHHRLHARRPHRAVGGEQPPSGGPDRPGACRDHTRHWRAGSLHPAPVTAQARGHARQSGPPGQVAGSGRCRCRQRDWKPAGKQGVRAFTTRVMPWPLLDPIWRLPMPVFERVDGHSAFRRRSWGPVVAEAEVSGACPPAVLPAGRGPAAAPRPSAGMRAWRPAGTARPRPARMGGSLPVLRASRASTCPEKRSRFEKYVKYISVHRNNRSWRAGDPNREMRR